MKSRTQSKARTPSRMTQTEKRIDAMTGVAQPIVRIGDPATAKTLKSIETKISTDPAYAHLLLRQAGIVTPKGKLSKRFGG